MNFQGLTVVITGAAGGIGRHLSRAYAEKGAQVVLGDLAESGGEVLARDITASGGRAFFVAGDLNEPNTASLWMEAALRETGRIDVLIHNAGIGIWKSPFELELAEWERVLNVNLRGAFLCAREAAKAMKLHNTGGSIVNIASTRALQSEPNGEAYAATKGGILSLSHALAMSLGPDRIRVNAISPGWIETGEYASLREQDHGQHPAGRVGQPEDVVKACFYLTDPANDFVTGTNLVLDGGMTRKMIYEP